MDGIPLYLIPQAVARQVRDWGDNVYRISVKRTHHHHYHVIVRTKSLVRELVPRKDDDPEGAGTGPGRARHRRRGCAA